jgi:dTDP-4-dehydrorhamnose 3,5-epimerase
MKIWETDFEGLFLLEPRVFRDDRDFCLETFREEALRAVGVDVRLVQD